MSEKRLPPNWIVTCVECRDAVCASDAFKLTMYPSRDGGLVCSHLAMFATDQPIPHQFGGPL